MLHNSMYISRKWTSLELLVKTSMYCSCQSQLWGPIFDPQLASGSCHPIYLCLFLLYYKLFGYFWTIWVKSWLKLLEIVSNCYYFSFIQRSELLTNPRRLVWWSIVLIKANKPLVHSYMSSDFDAQRFLHFIKKI